MRVSPFNRINKNDLKPVPEIWDPVFFTIRRKPSAVLVLFIETRTDAQMSTDVLFIRRSTWVGSHRGQIGFPGGRLEAGDLNPGMTALRETREELGLDPNAIQLLGMLPSVPALDGSLVFPICGVMAAEHCLLTPSPVEVQDVLRASAEKILISNPQKFSFNMFGCWRDSFLYDCDTFKVWGLSAEILAKMPVQQNE